MTPYVPLGRMALRRARHRPFQYVLLILGIALGVAMIVAVDLTNGSAQRAFTLSAEAVTGQTTHRVVSGRAGALDEQIYLGIRKQGYDLSAPVIEGYVSVPKIANRPLRLMGIDPFAEPPFRPYLWSQQNVAVASSFLTRRNGVMLSRDFAAVSHLALGDAFMVKVGGVPTTVTLVGVIAPSDEITAQRLNDLIVTDISTAQELLHMSGRLSHIDLIIRNAALENQIEQSLPAGVYMETADDRANAVKQMSAAFHVNLTSFSLIALLVGIFLIYNTVTFNVVQRRTLFGILRSLGVSRKQLFCLIMCESSLAALIGAGLGLLFGMWLAEALLGLVTRTINDFYYVVNVRQVAVSGSSLIKGSAIGVVAVLVASVPPAMEAMRAAPANASRRSALEGKVSKLIPWLWLAALLLATCGVLLLGWPSHNLVVAFLGLYAVLVAFAVMTPPVARSGLLRSARVLGLCFGPLGRMAPRTIVRSLSRTSVAIAALMTAVSVIIGVSMMVGSFRQTFVDWLDSTLRTDIHVSPPSLNSGHANGDLSPDAVATLRSWPGVRSVLTARYSSVFDPDWGREVELMAVTGDISEGKRSYQWVSGDAGSLWSRFLAGDGVMLSEPLVTRQQLKTPPEPITLMTEAGPRRFPVLAVFSDFSSDRGVVLMDQGSYRQHWHDENVTTAALFLDKGVAAAAVLNQLRERFAGREDIVVESSRSIRDAAVATFDRSFAVTGALQMVATVVAFIGVLGALMSLELDRTHELGIFRAIGMTTAQLWRLTFIEAGLMGAVAGVLAMPSGFALAWILIQIINVRSFGWTLTMKFDLGYFVQPLLIAVIAALAAGVYPAWRLARMSVAAAIREE
ncbi:FtsX-like permease family protein [Mycobacterium sp. ML4]